MVKVFLPVLCVVFLIAGWVGGHPGKFPFERSGPGTTGERTFAGEIGFVSVEPDEGVSPRPAEVIHTGLHRLLVKQIPLAEDADRGGAMTRLENRLYVFINRNHQNDERLRVYDLDDLTEYEAGDLRVPMNLGELLTSGITELGEFDLTRFRVYGLYAEKSREGGHAVFVSHGVYDPGRRCISFTISRTTLDVRNRQLRQTSGWETIFTARPCISPEQDKVDRDGGRFEGVMAGRYAGHMSGGKMIEYDPATLLVSVGSFHRDGDSFEGYTRDPSSAFGKFLLVDKAGGGHTVYATGSRNAQGLYRDAGGTVWSTDHGPMGGDELNIVEKGKHFGWPEETYGINYGSRPWVHSGRQGRHDRYDRPVFAWMPSVAPTAITRIGGKKFELWRGDLIVGSLAGLSLHRLRIEDGDRVVYSEPIPLGHRLRDMAVLPDDAIALLTDDGHLLIVDDGGPVYERRGSDVERLVADLDRYDRLAVAATGQRPAGAGAAAVIFMQKCSSCHSLEGVHEIGPHLHGIGGRKIGGADDYNYSAALSARDEIWTPDLLKAFLLEPGREFPNSRMPPVPLNEAEADSIVGFLLR